MTMNDVGNIGQQYHESLIAKAKDRISEAERAWPAMTRKGREASAIHLSEVLSSSTPFSFLRMGDMEIVLLIANQEDQHIGWEDHLSNSVLSSRQKYGHPGLEEKLVPRLRKAYEKCTFLDMHDAQWLIRGWLPDLRLNRSGAINSTPSDSHIFTDWFLLEFKKITRNKRVLFVGGEAAILRELWVKKKYKEIVHDYIEPDTECFFLEEFKVSGCLDDVKARIVTEIKKNDIDMTFISLGGGAKIIVYEIATELSTKCFDFGVLMRSLTYSGSDRHLFARSTHDKIYFRLPFDLYMDALEKAIPELTAQQLLVKAQCQVLIEASPNYEPGWQMTNDLVQPDSKRLLESLKSYKTRYAELAMQNHECRKLTRDFDIHVTEIIHGRGSLQWWLTRIQNRIKRFIS
jgi:hypothetical protein